MPARRPRCEPESSLRGAQARVQKYRLGGWLSVRLEGRQVVWTEDGPAQEKEAVGSLLRGGERPACGGNHHASRA